MPKASAIANELRRLADAFDKEPETELIQPLLTFHCTNYRDGSQGKEVFLALVRLFPKPLTKVVNDTTYEIEQGRNGDNAPVWFRARIDRGSICTIVEPARPAIYKCLSILSEAEEAALESA